MFSSAAGRQVVRATRNRLAVLFVAFFLGGTSPILQAQTNSGPVFAPPAGHAPTNAPADAAPVVTPTASPAVNSALDSTPPLPPAQLNPANPTAQASGPGEDIDDIRPPYFYLRSWFWFWVVLGLLALFGLIIFLVVYFRQPGVLSAKSAYELTLEKLEQARSMLREDNPVPYAVFVSETIRSYLGYRFQAPSTRRTTEEFLRQMETDRATPLAEHRDLLREFLHSCDLVKFARYQPQLVELEQVQSRAYTFVTATKPAPVTAAHGRRA